MTLLALAREGSAEQVNDAYNAQVLAAALSVGLSHALDARGIQAEAMLGFSLGQISALMASGALSDEEWLRFTRCASSLYGSGLQGAPGRDVCAAGCRS